MGYRVVTVNPLKSFPLPSFGLANITSLEDAEEQIKGKGRDEHIAALEVRWPKIELALTLHLARQERRLAHFNIACRVVGCDNPRRQKRGGGNGRKAKRPGVRPLFCGGHLGLRKCLTKEMLAELHASSAKRVAVA